MISSPLTRNLCEAELELLSNLLDKLDSRAMVVIGVDHEFAQVWSQGRSKHGCPDCKQYLKQKNASCFLLRVDTRDIVGCRPFDTLFTDSQDDYPHLGVEFDVKEEKLPKTKERRRE
jgi:hypothetical protein